MAPFLKYYLVSSLSSKNISFPQEMEGGWIVESFLFRNEKRARKSERLGLNESRMCVFFLGNKIRVRKTKGLDLNAV
jgi:hypothetical protein